MGDEAEVYAECHKFHEDLSDKVDGCRQFIPRITDPLVCDGCGCHQSFHRKEERYIRVHTRCQKIQSVGIPDSFDGCQQFMPGGEESTPEALTCAVCGCHRGFHRLDIRVRRQ